VADALPGLLKGHVEKEATVLALTARLTVDSDPTPVMTVALEGQGTQSLVSGTMLMKVVDRAPVEHADHAGKWW